MGVMMSIDFGEIDGQFDFYAVVTPDGHIPTVDEDSRLNEPSGWYLSPIGTLAHLSHYALVFTEWEDAQSDYQLHRDALPEGTKIRAFRVQVDEIDNVYEGFEDRPI